MVGQSAAATADLTQLVRDLRYAAQNVDRSSEEILDDVAELTYTLMIQYAPKRSGRLASAIRIIKNPGRREVTAVGVPYDVFQEYGTATRGEFPTKAYEIVPKQAGGRLTFQIGDRWVSTTRVIHPGIPPHPFARPAAREALEGITQRYQTMGVDLIMKGRAR